MAFRLKKKVVANTDRRKGERIQDPCQARLCLPGGTVFEVAVANLSHSGFCVLAMESLPVGMIMRAGFPNGRMPHVRVSRNDDGVCGFEFLGEVDPAELLQAAVIA